MSDNYKEKLGILNSYFHTQKKEHFDPEEYMSGNEEFNFLFNQRYKDNTNLRKWLTDWTITVVTIWLFLVILLISLNDGRFSDSVIITLLGTTTINILGLPYIIINRLFSEK